MAENGKPKKRGKDGASVRVSTGPFLRTTFFNHSSAMLCSGFVVVYLWMENHQRMESPFSFVIGLEDLRDNAETIKRYIENIGKAPSESLTTPFNSPDPSFFGAPVPVRILQCARRGDIAEITLHYFPLISVLPGAEGAGPVEATPVAVLVSSCQDHINALFKILAYLDKKEDAGK